jgi:hypothetical protein
MIRNGIVLSIAFFVAITVLSQPLGTIPAAPESLTASQLSTLIAEAKTPAEHERIARYYEAMAEEYRAEAQKHEAMLAGFMANPLTNNEKARLGTMDHCEYVVRSLNQRARKTIELAQEQEKMAQAAETK